MSVEMVIDVKARSLFPFMVLVSLMALVPCMTAVAQSEGPNLGITSVSYDPDDPMENMPVMIEIVVTNDGDTVADQVVVNLIVDGDVSGVQIFEKMDAGTTKTMFFTWMAQAGTHTIMVSVDPDDSVQESNEDDNVVVDRINIIAEPDVDIYEPPIFFMFLPIIIIIVVVVVVIVVIIILARRPPPPMPYPYYTQQPYQGYPPEMAQPQQYPSQGPYQPPGHA